MLYADITVNEKQTKSKVNIISTYTMKMTKHKKVEVNMVLIQEKTTTTTK